MPEAGKFDQTFLIAISSALNAHRLVERSPNGFRLASDQTSQEGLGRAREMQGKSPTN